jgi:archaellum biogenesis ATPase FlaH
VARGNDSSGDNLIRYDDDSAYCFACGHTILSEEYRNDFNWEEVERGMMSKTPLTKEERDELLEATGTQGQDSRGLTDKTYRYFAVRFGYDDNGNVDSHYYPVTDEKGDTTAFKVRYLPKTFSWIGKGGKDSQLFGQWKHTKSNAGGKYVVIACGEVDAMSAHQMLEDYRISRNSDFAPIPVVSSVVGETASYKQIQAQYEWLNRYDQIILIPDQDDAGQEAVEAISKVVPKNKLRICSLPEKDCNDMLTKGKHKQFIQAFYDAKPYVPIGVVGSSQLYDAVLNEAMVEKLKFPPFMKRLNELTAGGLAGNSICLISAFTSIGKSTIVNEMVYDWIFNSPHKVGVVSMEQNTGQYGELMLSRHIGIKLGKLEQVDKLKLLQEEWVQKKQQELFLNEDGSDRWMVVDDRDSSTEALQAAIEKLIIQCNCKVIVIDTLTDWFDSMPVDEQEKVMKWQKSIVNRYGVILINIVHQRKTSANQTDGSKGGEATESGIHGTSTQIKSASLIVTLKRDKLNECETTRNTVFVGITKNRGAGETGDAGAMYYDNKTHTLHDLDEWLTENTNNT